MQGLVEPATRAAAAVRSADALVICAGAGMGVDSGLADFRGPEASGARIRRSAGSGSSSTTSPIRGGSSPPRSRGAFTRHRLDLYHATTPHAGFALLQRRAARATAGAFVFTSNVDVRIQRADFHEANVEACHRSISHLQCVKGCDLPPWSAAETAVSVDVETQGRPERLPRRSLSSRSRRRSG